MKKFLLIPAMCVLCFACSNDNNGTTSTTTQTQDTSSDWEITTKVKSAIMSDSSISASARFVSVTTNDGVVTLSGSVASSDDKDRIVKITKKVSGVKSVDNQMTVSNS